jgi:serine protease AprX
MRGKGWFASLGILTVISLLVVTVQANPRPGVPVTDLSQVPTVPMADLSQALTPSPSLQVGAPAPTKLAPALTKALAQADAAERIPVVVSGLSPAQVGALLGGAPVTHTYAKAMTGFAASLTPAQIKLLASQTGIRSIVPDVPVVALNDGMTAAVGSNRVNQIHITGDRDGDPRRYSTADVVIAVIDTGIDAGHQDLAGKVVGWYDVVGGRPEPYDDHGHGTHVAAIAAGAGRANRSMKGVAPGAALVGVKVLSGSGSGSLAGVIEGVEWVIAHKDELGIKVVNLSLGAAVPSDGTDPLSLAVNALADAGIVPVVAAGNSGPRQGTVGTPGAAAKAITVCAMVDPARGGWALAPYSSRGPTLDGRIKPDICAPGYAISSAQAGTSGGYAALSGTSMATPVVAGTAALMLAVNPQLTPERVKAYLTETAVDWGAPGQDVDWGWGELDALAAVRRAMGQRQPAPLPGPTHQAFTGTLAGDAEQSFVLVVTQANRPLALTLLQVGPDQAAYDLDLLLYDERGQLLARAATGRPEELILYRPSRPGRLQVKVRAVRGSGPFTLDASFD